MEERNLTVVNNTEDNNDETKMSLEEYQAKHSRPVNEKVAKSFLFIFAAAIGIIIFLCLFLIEERIYNFSFDEHHIAFFVTLPVMIAIYVLVYIVPIVRITQTKAFITNVDVRNVRQAQKYNKAMREDIADKMIDIQAKTSGVSWYSADMVGKLAIARNTHDDKSLKKVLTQMYDTDVKAAANKMIREHAFKVGLTTALSQSEKIDTLFVCVYDLNLIKDLIYLYGFRPSDTKLMKIYQTVLANALISYGLGNATGSVATGVVKKLGKVVDKVPVLGSAIGTVIDSVSQGIINSSLTVVIGFQTKKYLMKEYHLQDILDNVVLSEEEEALAEQALIDDLSEDLKKAKKNPQAA